MPGWPVLRRCELPWLLDQADEADALRAQVERLLLFVDQVKEADAEVCDDMFQVRVMAHIEVVLGEQ